MLGTHNSFTYLEPKCFIFNWFKKFWKCQDKTIKEQIAEGVRLFDVRVRLKGDVLQVCHGLVDLDMQFSSIEGMIRYFKSFNLSHFMIRLVLENGLATDEVVFIGMLNSFIENNVDDYNKHIHSVIIRYPSNGKYWDTFITNECVEKTDELFFTPWLKDISLIDNITRFLGNSIMEFAEKNNKDVLASLKSKHYKDYKNFVLIDYV